MSKNKSRENNTLNNKLYLLPIILSISLLPLVVYLKTFYSKTYDFPWFPDTQQYDLFLYSKSRFFILIAIIAVILFIYKFFNDKTSIKKNYVFLTLGGFGLLALLSSVFSPWREAAFSGVLESFEPIWVVLGYIFIAFYSYQCIQDEEDIKYILKWFIISIIIVSLIGLTQLLSNDIYLTSFIRDLIIPSNLSSIGKLESSFEQGRVYLSNGNPNYVGSYTSIILPILIGSSILFKNIKYRILSGTLSCLIFIYLLSSQSRGGFFAVIVSVIMAIIFFRKKLFKNIIIPIAILSIFIVAFVGINIMTNGTLLNRLKSSFTGTNTEYPLTSMETNDDNVALTYKNNSIYIKFSHNKNTQQIQLNVFDSKDNPLPLISADTNGYYKINDPSYDGLFFKPVPIDDSYGFAVHVDGFEWTFTNTVNDETFYYKNLNGNFDKMISPKRTYIFSEEFASSRGYIWNTTIPLLKDNILLGTGADTFVYTFPNNDYIGKYNAKIYENLLTRPHNMYLQIGVQFGVVALMLFLVFYLYYFIQCIKLYFKSNFDTLLKQAGTIIFISTAGYMIAGLVNDSSISSAPIFWVLLGIGVAINNMVKLSTTK